MLHSISTNSFESPLLRPSSACSGTGFATQNSAATPKFAPKEPQMESAQPEPLEPEANESSAPTFDGKFGDLVDQLKEVLGKDKGLTSKDIDVEKVKQIMASYQSNEEEWGKFALHDPSRNYSRNGIVDINDNANLLILVWLPGKSSPIHDHANAHCCMKILKGQLTESLYEVPEDSQGPHEMVCKKKTDLPTDVVGYISDDIGLHKISNNLENEYSISLHLYTPPYAAKYGFSMYEANGKKHHVDMAQCYSWQGKKN